MLQKTLEKVLQKFSDDVLVGVLEDSEIKDMLKNFKIWFSSFGEDYVKSFKHKEQGNHRALVDVEAIDLMSIDVDDAATTIIKHKLEKFYDEKGNASHYNQNRLNAMIKYEVVWGTLGVMVFCEINAEKYKDRLGKKDNQSPEQELIKIKWYEDAAKFYFNRLGTSQEVNVSNRLKQNNPWDN